MLRIATQAFATAAIAAVLAGFAAAPALAQDYPTRPVEVIVPFGAGGSSDIVARTIQQALEGKFPQPVVVVNKPGAAGSLGTAEVTDAEPDGYTILSSHIGIAINEALGVSDIGYDDFEPVAETGRTDLVFAVPTDSPYQTFDEVIAAAKEKPNAITHATNLGSVVHFTMLGVTKATGAEFRYVQVGGGGERLPVVVGNQVESALFGVSEALPYHESGEMRILAILTDERWPALPDVPTAKELGYDLPEPTSLGYWYFAPKGTPQERIDILADAIEAAMTSEEMKASFQERGFSPSFLRGEAFAQAVNDADANIKLLAEEFGVTSQ
jgi:tripartite-type tricarboxylate transporter receptor subunit TctC